jgi:hypothetical protein
LGDWLCIDYVGFCAFCSLYIMPQLFAARTTK